MRNFKSLMQDSNVMFYFLELKIQAFSCLSIGIFFVMPCTDSFVKVDLRTVSFDIPPQEVGVAQRTTPNCLRGNYFN